jgi:microcystin degradation protein MlrC
LANELADYLIMHRQEFRAKLPGVEEAIDLAEKSTPPVCLLDLGDNVGGGSPGDGTIIAQSLVRRRIVGALVCLCDPIAAKLARDSGAGTLVELQVGGKMDQLHGPPLQLRARIRSLHEGTFGETQVRHGGKSHYDMGPSAVLEAGGLTLLVHSLRMPPFSLNQITSCDLVPEQFQMIVAKGVNAPLAAYGPVCRTFIRVDTPGVTTAAMTQLPFKHRRRPLFPFEELIGPAVLKCEAR